MSKYPTLSFILCALLSTSWSFAGTPQDTAQAEQNVYAIEQIAPAQDKKLSPNETASFLKSSEAGAWRVYAVQGPLCTTGEGKKPKDISAKAWAAKKKECVRLNTECRKAQNLAKKYSVQSICSNVYYEIDVLLTTASASLQ